MTIRDPVKTTHFDVSAHRGDTIIENGHTHVRPKGDLIRLKEDLENKFFGNDHPQFKDNIHVQLAYSVLDIYKTLSVYINNIIYSLNNVAGLGTHENDQHDDLFESLRWRDYNNFLNDGKAGLFQKLRESKRLGYFGSSCDWLAQEDEYAFSILSNLGQIRQYTAHFDTDLFRNSNNRPQVRIAADLYANYVAHLNNEFVNNSVKDYMILFDVYDCENNPEGKPEHIQTKL